MLGLFTDESWFSVPRGRPVVVGRSGGTLFFKSSFLPCGLWAPSPRTSVFAFPLPFHRMGAGCLSRNRWTTGFRVVLCSWRPSKTLQRIFCFECSCLFPRMSSLSVSKGSTSPPNKPSPFDLRLQGKSPPPPPPLCRVGD